MGCKLPLRPCSLRCAEGKCAASSMVLADNTVMVFECGPWTGCRLGAACPQAVTQQVLPGTPPHSCSWTQIALEAVLLGVRMVRSQSVSLDLMS